MTRFLSWIPVAAIKATYPVLISVVFAAGFLTAQTSTANFEASQANPIRMSADGTRLFAVNTPNGTVSVFSLTQPTSPTLIAEIPVGIEPVSVNPRTDDEAWVVNEISGSVSIISVSQGIVTATINVGSEPHDVVFAAGLAYVSVSRDNAVLAYNVTAHALVASLALFGGSPRALAVSPTGNKVYAAMAISGNATTIIPRELAPAQSAPTNTSLPAPPQVGLIVQASDPNWTADINYIMPDYDVAIIGTGAAPSVLGYYSGVGTINLGIAVNPTNGDIYVTNTDALNTIHFETNLLGHFVNNRVTQIQLSTRSVTPYDLNPGLNYSVLPNTLALASALAQPAGIVFNPSGTSMWIAAFGTDRVANVDTSGNVLSFVEVAQASGAGSNIDPIHKKGPRGLALNSTANTLYVLNRISNTISIVNTSTVAVVSEIAVGYDATPTAIHQGRGFLYDAKLSGNGTGSCASCHVDGDMDHLAWDLGDPAGSLTTTVEDGVTLTFHPMKGPMTTQTFKGLVNLSPYHWRGDHANLAAFNTTFPDLLGGSELSTSDLNTYITFLNSIQYQPNPNESLNRTLPTSFGKGNASNGLSDFVNLALTQVGSTSLQTCNNCHLASPSGPGTNRFINPVSASGQAMKNPQLRNLYQKLLREPVSTPSGGLAVIDGFGLDHDGSASGIGTFFAASLFGNYTALEKADIFAYLQCFDTGTAPAVGYTSTMTSATVAAAATVWSTLEAQATAANIDLVARGTVSGVVHGLRYSPSANNYVLDTGGTLTHAQLLTLIQGGDTMSIMGMYPGTGTAAVGTLL